MTNPAPALTENFQTTPYWWEDSPLSNDSVVTIPTRADIAIIGAGLSGLMIGLELARAGLDVVIFDAARPGEHASTRNFGAIGRTIRLSFSNLMESYGEELATRVYQEAKIWVDYTVDFVEREKLDCRFRRAGRAVAAHSQQAFDSGVRELDKMQKYLDVATTMVPRDQQHTELGSDVYHGCAVYADVGHLDPGRFHAGLDRLATKAGAKIIDQTRVLKIERKSRGFQLNSSRGLLTADQIVLATNAETGNDNSLFQYFYRRMLPVQLASAVSEPLDQEILNQVFPRDRTVLETRRLYTGIRPVVGENRLLVVGQHLRQFADPQSMAIGLQRDLGVRYQQLKTIKFSHIWEGRFCITFDWLPHLGTHQGVHYLHGLNCAGVPACGYLGHKLAQRILGQTDCETVFADRPYPKRFGYRGNAWFLPMIGHWYRARDRFESRLSR